MAEQGGGGVAAPPEHGGVSELQQDNDDASRGGNRPTGQGGVYPPAAGVPSSGNAGAVSGAVLHQPLSTSDGAVAPAVAGGGIPSAAPPPGDAGAAPYGSMFAPPPGYATSMSIHTGSTGTTMPMLEMSVGGAPAPSPYGASIAHSAPTTAPYGQPHGQASPYPPPVYPPSVYPPAPYGTGPSFAMPPNPAPYGTLSHGPSHAPPPAAAPPAGAPYPPYPAHAHPPTGAPSTAGGDLGSSSASPMAPSPHAPPPHHAPSQQSQHPAASGAAASAPGLMQGGSSDNRKVLFRFRGQKLDRKDMFSKSDPFLVLYASRQFRTKEEAVRDSEDWVKVHETEYVINDHDPDWRPFAVSFQKLTRGDAKKPILIECYDWDEDLQHDFIGYTITNYDELRTLPQGMKLINRRRLGLGNTAGFLKVLKCEERT